MLWYLLYPLRGTTQPPRLSANHPVRRAFYRHGKTTAEHWLIAMLVTVAIAMAFSYPTILLAENPTTGLGAYPHHVWTTAKPYDTDPENADVELRQVWIHGSYMRALEKEVLIRALDIQQTLIEQESWTSILPTLRSSELSWGYHSPLMYWNSSRQIIEGDDDVLRTINQQAGSTSSSLGVALRPASVFAGKKFDHRKLVAADALVITLINKAGDDAGDQWRQRLISLTTGACRDCTMFPQDGHITRSRAYEFSFTPLSTQENIALTVAYSVMAMYVLLSLRRIKAFHSRFGLVVTAITQMTCSVLASFTICGMLKINLSMIPQNAYPFVVLVIGLENMFRIINAVLAYPPTMATDLRIANALGDVGPVSVAAAAQNVLILSLLASVVSPGVAAFCAFACIATLFDAFFLLTFFVAVLMVDIRRFELQDALARANQSKHKRKPSPVHHHTWFDALVHGRLPFTTRMAGTAVTTTFILSLNYHFFEHREQATSLAHLFRLIKKGPPNLGDFDTFAPLPINATLTPGQWMRMQDFDTAKEVMRLAVPGADSFIIRIFSPLIIVLPGADRTGIEQQEWTTALRSFAMHHFYPVATAVVFAVAFVAVLMNFLLYTEHEDEHSVDSGVEDALSVKTLSLPHGLDIIKLAATKTNHFVSIALDRTIAISIHDRAENKHRVLGVSSDVLSRISWPIHCAAIEETGEWTAFHCGDEQIVLYDVATGSISGNVPYPDDNPSLIFQFMRVPCASAPKLYFMVLTSGGRASILDVGTGASTTLELANTPLLGAKLVESPNQEKRLLTVTDEGDLMDYRWTDDGWSQANSQSLSIPKAHGRVTGAIAIELYSELDSNILIITHTRHVAFLDGSSLVQLNRIEIDEHGPSLGGVLLGPPTKCAGCGLPAVRGAAALCGMTGDLETTVATFSPLQGEEGAICLQRATPACSSFSHARKSTRSISNHGVWAILVSQILLGFRRRQPEGSEQRNTSQRATRGRLRRRGPPLSTAQTNDHEDSWEAYRLSADGSMDKLEVSQASSEPDSMNGLYVTRAGPVASLDCQTIAVAFGNVVKIVRSVRRGSVSRRSTGKSPSKIHVDNIKDDMRSIKSR